MPASYHDVLASVALRVNALTGAQASSLQTTYATRPLTSSHFQSARFPFDDIKSAIATAENLIAVAVADTPQHLWRKYLFATTGNLATGAALPTAISAVPVIGVPGDVRDASDGRKLTEKLFQEVRRITAASSYMLGSYYYYTITSSRVIYHTRTNVVVDVCTFDRDTRLTAVGSDGNLLFPESFPLLEAGALMLLSRDGRFLPQAQFYGQYFNDSLQAIAQGRASFASIPAPPQTVPGS